MNLRVNLPAMGALVGFEAAARHQSISKAAGELNLTHGAVSRSVQQLEQFFGFPLFERRNRRVVLTAKGKALADRLSPLLRELGYALDSVRQYDRDALVVSCEPTLAMRWIMPRLSDHGLSGMKIQLETAGGPVDLEGEGIDIAIRRSDFAWPSGYKANPLVPETVGPVCHPAYWERVGHRLDHAALLSTRTRPNAWRDWAEGRQMPLPDGPERLFDHFYFSLQAAVAGLGVAIGPRLMVQDDIEAGHLIAPFGFHASGYDYVALTAKDISTDSRLKIFLDWLAVQLEEAT